MPQEALSGAAFVAVPQNVFFIGRIHPPSPLKRGRSSFVFRETLARPAHHKRKQRYLTMTSDSRGDLRGKTVAVTGATGFIGRNLMRRLRKERCNIIVLARSPSKAWGLFPREAYSRLRVVQYDAATERGEERELRTVIERCDAVVNMAGEDISEGRWTAERKSQLWNSRVVGTTKIARLMAQMDDRERTFVSLSAVGYYGTSERHVFDESSKPGNDFLARLAYAWERASMVDKGRENEELRTVVIRMGVVLGRDGGALAKMKPAFKYFLGGPPGSGRQKFSWIHVDDAVDILVAAVKSASWTGIYNATAPRPVPLAEFCKALGDSMGRPSWLPVPSFALKALVGHEAAQLVLAGQEVIPKRTLQNGYRFKYCNVRDALRDLCGATIHVGLGS